MIRKPKRIGPSSVAGLLVAVLTLAGCSSDADSEPRQGKVAATQSASGEASSTPSESETSADSADPALPEMQTVEQAGGSTIQGTTDADWTIVAFDRAWVSGMGKGIGVFDARSGKALGSVAVPERPCGGADAGFGAVWTATCVTDGIVRVDPKKARVTGKVVFTVPESESSVGVGEGAVWALTEGPDCFACIVLRINPRSLRITDRFPVPDGATALRAGLGGVWITYFGEDSVRRLDPKTGDVVATVPLPEGPRFLDVGGGSVWVAAQTAGELCQIDPADSSLVGCTVLDPTGVRGGQLSVGEGYVWWRGTQALVTQIDARTGEVIRQIGPGVGSGDASAGSGQLWVTAHDLATIYRLPVQP